LDPSIGLRLKCNIVVLGTIEFRPELEDDGSGNPLDDEGRYSLTRYSLEVQTTLLAFGMSSEALERIVKDFSR
jgi:hypothetical protein